MKFLPKIILAGLLFVLLCSSKSLSVKEQKKDLQIFREVLLLKESKINLHINSSEIIGQLDELESKFQNHLTLIEQFKAYGELLSKIQCGHTQIHPNEQIFREWLTVRKSLPIDYYLIGKRLVVNKLEKEDILIHKEGKSKYQASKKIKPGSEIIEINHKSIPEMMLEIGRFLSSDEDAVGFKYFQTAQLFEFYRHCTNTFDQDSIQVKYLNKNRDTTAIYFQIGAAPVYTITKRLSESEKYFQQKESNIGGFVTSGKYGIFSFQSFAASHGFSFEEFLENSFEKIKNKKIKNLIIDLRGNTGGVMQYSLMRYFVGENVSLGRYVVGKPKKMFESRHLTKFNSDYSKHRKISRKQKRLFRRNKFDNGEVFTTYIDPELVYNGQIVLLTDEGTFSSASILAAYLKTMCNAKIVGHSAGGSFFKGNAGTLTLKLPKSKMKVFINPNTFYSHLESVNNPLTIKIPDLIVDQIILDSKKRSYFYIKQAKKMFE
tara:strand:- start:624 stop:2090 length:1467 start_codon:yes stop_codon:yes gene_type:complete